MSDKQEIIFTSALIAQNTNYKHNEKSECQILGVSKNFIDKSEKKFIFYFWKGQASWHIPCQYWHLAWSCVWWISEAVADESPTPMYIFLPHWKQQNLLSHRCPRDTATENRFSLFCRVLLLFYYSILLKTLICKSLSVIYYYLHVSICFARFCVNWIRDA